jgi:hypothetical protein
MKFERTVLSLIWPLFAGLMAWSVVVAPSAYGAPTFWTGPNTNYDQAVNGPNDVLVPGKVVLTRAFFHCLFNTVTETLAGPGSPADTEWAFGNLSNFASLSYQPLYSYRNFDLSSVLVTVPPSPMVVHLVNEDIYLSVTFTRWPHGGGAFAYTRSTPAAVVAPPTVSITSPTNNTTLAAPANVTLIASASGTVTNVTFFDGNTFLRSIPNAPFTLTTNSLAARSYVFKAVATAAGISATSAVANVTVVSPIATSLAAAAAANDQFSFTYSANPGLRYVVESSSNLLIWTPVLTNVPASSPALFTNTILPGNDFYRVGRLPNP